MMFLILLACAFAAANAGYASPYHNFYHYPQPHAVIGHDGRPLETPEVQHAKAAHFAAHASSRYGHPAAGYHHNALPADTPEVAAAKLQHFHDYAVAAQRNGVHGIHGAYHGGYAPILAAGHPVDTPEVQHAKAAHFAAHAAARAGHHAHYRKKRELPYGGYHIPVLDHNGVPTETPEVQAAKAHHFAEYNRVAARPGQSIPDTHDYNGAYSHHQPQHYAAPNYYASAPLRGPGGPPAQIGPDGQPIETPEVRAAKAAHFAAYAAVNSGHYGHFGKK